MRFRRRRIKTLKVIQKLMLMNTFLDILMMKKLMRRRKKKTQLLCWTKLSGKFMFLISSGKQETTTP